MKGLASQYRFLRLAPRGFPVIAKPAGGMIGLGGFRIMIVLLLLAASLIMVPLSGAETLHDRSLRKLQDRLAKTNPQDFTFIVVGDSRDGDEIFRKLLATAASFNPLFLLHTGDMTRNGTPEEYDRFLGIVNDTVPEIPLFAIIGNHDIDRKGIPEGTQKRYYTDRIGPLYYVLDIPSLELRLVALDNSDYRLSASQLTYLREKLEEKGALRIVAMHVPPEVGRWKGHGFVKGKTDLVQALAEQKVNLAIFSHYHLYDDDVIQGVRYVLSGGGGAPLHFQFPFGQAAYHITVVRVHEGVVSHSMVRLAD